MTRIFTGAIVAAFIAAPAFAGVQTFDIELSIQPSQIETVSDAEAAYDEMSEQIEATCKAEAVNNRFMRLKSIQACEKNTVDSAVKSINHPLLNEVHEARIES